MLALHPSEVRALVEDGRLDAVQVSGRWLISADSVDRLSQAPGAPETDLRRLEERVAELERRLGFVDRASRADTGGDGVRPALEPLFRTTD